jgi:tRNA 2-thiouridine synthesizing protein D
LSHSGTPKAVPRFRFSDLALWASKPCVDARGLVAGSLDKRVKLGGMNEFHTAAKQADVKVIRF